MPKGVYKGMVGKMFKVEVMRAIFWDRYSPTLVDILYNEIIIRSELNQSIGCKALSIVRKAN